MTSDAIRRAIRALVRATAAHVLFVGLAVAANGAQAAPDTTSASNPIIVHTREPAAHAAGGPAEQLLARARAKGKIFVIVTLRTTLRMEHTLGLSEAAAQRRRLDDIQSGVAQRALGSASALDEADRFTFIPSMAMKLDAAQLRRLLLDPEVVSVQEDLPVPPSLRQSVPLIHATDLFTKNVTGANQVVAILDTGVQSDHDMLKGKVVYQACLSTDSPPDIDSLCPNGRQTMGGPGSGEPCKIAGCYHGTHVASIAAGNSAVLDGVARSAKIISLQIFSKTVATGALGARERDQIRALQVVYRLRARFKIAAVNMSLGSGRHLAACDREHPALKLAIDNLIDAGIPTVIASGNDGYASAVNFPACISSAIAVGNSQKDDLLQSTSNQSPQVKLFAPGTAITAAIPGNRYGRLTGTSMAAPHVAGAFALLESAKPEASPEDILEALKCSGKTIYERLRDNTKLRLNVSKPRINVLGAWQQLKTPDSFSRTWQFSSPDEAKDWSPFRGKWTIGNGNYQLRDYGVAAYGILTANCSTTFKAVARVRNVDSVTSKVQIGLLIKASVNFKTQKISGYVVYHRRWRSDDPKTNATWYVLRFDDFALDGSNINDTLICRGDLIHTNENGYNTLVAESQESSLTFRINGIHLCTVTDDTYKTGDAGVIAFVDRNPPNNFFDVDAFQIRSLPPVQRPSVEAKAKIDAADEAPTQEN